MMPAVSSVSKRALRTMIKVSGGPGMCPPGSVAYWTTTGPGGPLTDCIPAPGGGEGQGTGGSQGCISGQSSAYCPPDPKQPTPLSASIASKAKGFEGLHPGCSSALNGDYGNGCMWSVDQVMIAAGAGTIGNGSDYIDSALRSALNAGQITLKSSYPTTPIANATGDIVDWWGGDGQTTWSGCEADNNCHEHVGICLNSDCSDAIANSTTDSEKYQECDFADSGSAEDPQAQDAAMSHAQIIQVNR